MENIKIHFHHFNESDISISNFNPSKYPERKLALCLTNYVSIDFTANAICCCGHSPIMSFCKHDAKDLMNIANSLYINIGTINDKLFELFIQTAKIAKSQNKNIILDPVGAGASKMRMNCSIELLRYASIVKCNGSEIQAIHDVCFTDSQNTQHIGQGVDSNQREYDYAQVCGIKIAKKFNILVIITGPEDMIIKYDQDKNEIDLYKISFSIEMMKYIVGSGCALGGVISTFCGNTLRDNIIDTCKFALYGVQLYKHAAYVQMSQKNINGPSELKSMMLDYIYQSRSAN